MTAKAKPADPSDVLDPKKALVPSVVKINEARVTKGFWPKIQRTAARIPFADQALAAWYAARDPQTPMAAKGMIFAGLAYFVMPVAMPAQLTVSRSWPCAARAFSKAEATEASSVTSTWQKTPPISAAMASPFSEFRSNRATLAPVAAMARAVPSPRPEAPPVTTAAMLLSSFILIVPILC